MTLDMSQFHQVFFEEAQEHLSSMESLLLELDVGAPDLDALNAIFRAAHSIKGGSSTFGFADMAELTHVAESLLDRLRNQELQPTASMVDVLLRAGDVLKLQLAAHRGGDAVDPAEARSVHEALEIMAAQGGITQGAAVPDRRVAPGTSGESAPADRTVRVSFVPRKARADLGPLLEALGRLGTVSEPERAPRVKGSGGSRGATVSVVMATARPDDEIREVFAFTLDVRSLEIEPFPGVDAGGGYGLFEEAPAAPDQGFGFFTDDHAPAVDPGYGLFAEAPAPAADPGYGLFVDAREQPADPAHGDAAGRSLGRRASDDPRTDPMPVGRRASDKIAVSAQSEQSSIRVGVEKVDQLINQVGELVITQAMLAQAASALDPVAFEKLVSGIAQLERNTRDLQESVMAIRMMPMAVVFSRFPRVVRDLATKLGKKVELKTVGEGTELDKGLIEKITDPLTHLVRNSLDHGIESPELRAAAGKSEVGTITLSAYHQGGNIVIDVADDGAGLNRERILAKARERGLPVTDTMPDADVWMLIFEAGFSTAEKVTDVSGRGVGMDVVKRNIHGLGGSVEIESVPGGGTRMSIRLPLTLAILDGLSVAVGDETFIVPLNYIVESLQPSAEDIRTVSGSGRVLRVRGEYLPVLSLSEVFNVRAAARDFSSGIIVIIEAEGSRVAMFVDSLLGQHQVVIKSLESNYRRVSGISGATIMGDGRVALILDVGGLVRMSRHTEPRGAEAVSV